MDPTGSIEVKSISPRRYVGVRRVVKRDGLGPLYGEVIPRLSSWLSERGIAPAGPPMLVYHSVNRETGEFDVEAALFVSAPMDGEGDIGVGETAGGEALFALHVGPYSTLGDTWHAVFARAEHLKRPVTKSSWEVYVNDPSRAEPAALRTEIYVPIDRVG
jgi:effector-binding domain-containing protein